MDTKKLGHSAPNLARSNNPINVRSREIDSPSEDKPSSVSSGKKEVGKKKFCQTFAKIIEGEAQVAGLPLTVTIKDDRKMQLTDTLGKSRLYTMDSVYHNLRPDSDIFLDALLPLLNTVLYEHKDATLLLFGPRKSGKSTIVGTAGDFDKRSCMVTEALGFLFSKTEDFSLPSYLRLQISCFEVFADAIYDLIKISDDSKVEGTISSHYVKDFQAAVKLFKAAFRKRKRNVQGTYEENQSHVFINVEAIHMEKTAKGDVEQHKGVLTIVDLAGWDPDFSNWDPSMDNESSFKDKTLLYFNLNDTHMSDCCKKTRKENFNNEIIQKSIFTSLRSFIGYVYSFRALGIGEKEQKEDDLLLDTKSFLVQLLMQNMKTDAKIFLLVLINKGENNYKEATETLEFAENFSKCVARLIESRPKTKGKETSYILADLQKELNKSYNISESFSRKQPAMEPEQGAEVFGKDEMPQELLTKLHGLAATPHEEVASRATPDFNADLAESFIPKQDISRRGSCFSGILSPEDRILLKSIKSIDVDEKIPYPPESKVAEPKANVPHTPPQIETFRQQIGKGDAGFPSPTAKTIEKYESYPKKTTEPIKYPQSSIATQSELSAIGKGIIFESKKFIWRTIEEIAHNNIRKPGKSCISCRGGTKNKKSQNKILAVDNRNRIDFFKKLYAYTEKAKSIWAISEINNKEEYKEVRSYLGGKISLQALPTSKRWKSPYCLTKRETILHPLRTLPKGRTDKRKKINAIEVVDYHRGPPPSRHPKRSKSHDKTKIGNPLEKTWENLPHEARNPHEVYDYALEKQRIISVLSLSQIIDREMSH